MTEEVLSVECKDEVSSREMNSYHVNRFYVQDMGYGIRITFSEQTNANVHACAKSSVFLARENALALCDLIISLIGTNKH